MTRRELAAFEVPLAALSAAALVFAWMWASTGIPAWVPAGLLVRIGVASPVSGMTRSFVAMASGDPMRAFLWHPLGPVVFAVCAAVPFIAVASWVRGGRLPAVSRVLHSNTAWFITAAASGAAWIRQILVLS